MLIAKCVKCGSGSDDDRRIGTVCKCGGRFEKVTGVVLGIGNRERLIKFFQARGQRNLVLRIVDVLEQRNDYQDFLIRTIENLELIQAGKTGVSPTVQKGLQSRKDFFLGKWPAGWIVLPLVDYLQSMSFDDVVKLQELIYNYQNIRCEKGEPCVVEQCRSCGGQGCDGCCGMGKTTTLVEMSEEEEILSRKEF